MKMEVLKETDAFLEYHCSKLRSAGHNSEQVLKPEDVLSMFDPTIQNTEICKAFCDILCMLAADEYDKFMSFLKSVLMRLDWMTRDTSDVGLKDLLVNSTRNQITFLFCLQYYFTR
jgi:hypothetical protein